jgi:hypothetical protein
MRRITILVLLLALLAGLFGCVQSGYDIFVDKGRTQKWTSRQIEAAWDLFLKNSFMEETDEGYVIDYTKVTVEDAWVMAGNVLGDLDQILSTSNPSWRKLLAAIPSEREAFEREEQRWLYIQSQLGQVKTYLSFREMLGYTVTEEEKAYSIKYLWPANVDVSYEAEYITNAREAGTLKEVERFVSYVYTPLGYKDRDPAAPDDTNAFIWRSKLQGYLIISYAILNDKQPSELKADYTEVYRVEINGLDIIPEEKPCLRAMKRLSGKALEVMVIDYDSEGEAGFGVVDEVDVCYSRTGGALYESKADLFASLSESRQAEAARDRQWEDTELSLHIVRTGEIDKWRGDYNADGWTVPYEYKDEYLVDWLARKGFEDKPAGYPFHTLAYLAKRWSDGSVWEYYDPSEAYAGDLESCVTLLRNVRLQRKGEAPEELVLDSVCGALRAIIYLDGDEWVQLSDEDDTGILQYKIVGVANPNGSATPSYAEGIGGY